jgi:hypothetical protein
MTAKEKVLSVYPDAKVDFYYNGTKGVYILRVGDVQIDSIDSTFDNAEKQLIENVAKKLIKQGLCTE